MSEHEAMAAAAPTTTPSARGGAGKTRLPKSVTVSEAFSKLTRKIGTGCESALPSVDPQAILRLQLSSEKKTDFPDPVVLISEAGAIEFSEGSRLLRALTGIDLGTESDEDEARWSWMQAALIGRLGDTPFHDADSLTRSSYPADPHRVPMRVSVRTPHHAFSLLALAPASTWLDLLKHESWSRDRRPASDYFDIPFCSTIVIARHTMPIDALRTISTGDIFVPTSCRFGSDGEGSIQLAGLKMEVSYAGPSGLKIKNMEGDVELDDTGETVGQEDNDPFPAVQGEQRSGADTGNALDSIPVTLDFELGQVAMSFGALREIGVGAIIEVSGGSPACITIASNGRTLGQGEVVDVNGQLGIRVTHWGASS